MSEVKFRPLGPDDVEVRVGQCTENGCSLLLYKDARVDMRLLDEIIGVENWQCDYKSIDGKLFCGIGIRLQDGEWVWKWDTGTPSSMEAQKGEASDAFKRAGFKCGIGRELYTTPRIWVPKDKCTIKQGRNGKPQCYDDFRVVDMAVDDGQIVKLTICNMSQKGVTVYGSEPAREKPKDPDEPQNDVLKVAYDKMKQSVWSWCKRHGCADEDSFRAKLEGIKKRPEWATQNRSLEYLNAVAREFDDA